MNILLILAVLIFSLILSIVEMPQMLKLKLHRESWTFLILLAFGTTLTILQLLNVKIPNPSDLVLWIFSPLQGVIKALSQ